LAIILQEENRHIAGNKQYKSNQSADFELKHGNSLLAK
jgi:hypothetical protein